MAKPSKLKIDVTKVLKQYLFKGEKGTYLNCSVWPNQEGEDRFGFTHSIKQEIPKEARDAGEKEPYIGNLKLEQADTPRQQEPIRNRQQPRTDAPAKAEKEDFDF